MLNDDLENMGPVKVADVEGAQQKIIKVVKKLKRKANSSCWSRRRRRLSYCQLLGGTESHLHVTRISCSAITPCANYKPHSSQIVRTRSLRILNEYSGDCLFHGRTDREMIHH